MTVDTLNASQSFVADGVQTVFTFNFHAMGSTGLLPRAVYVTVGGALANPADWYMSLNPDQEVSAGGSVTFLTPPPNGAGVIIYRDTQLTQEVDFQPYTRFPAEHNETGLDKLTLIAQDQKAAADRLSLRVSQAEFEIDIAQSDIIQNAADIATNASDIGTNAAAIAVNASNISDNVDDIAALQTAVGDLEAVEHLSDDTQVLTITPSLLTGGDMTWSIKTNIANGLVKLNSSGEIDPIYLPPAVGNEFAGANPTLADYSAAIILGTNDPEIEPHIAIGPSLIQAKADENTAADIAINSLGGNSQLGNGAGGTTVTLRGQRMELQGSVGISYLTITPSTNTILDLTKNGELIVDGIKNDNSDTRLLRLDPNLHGTNFEGAAVQRLHVIKTDNITASYDAPPFMVGEDDGPNLRADTNTLIAANNGVLAPLTIEGSPVKLNDAAQTLIASAGGLQVNNTLTGAGYERVLTESDIDGFLAADGSVPMTGPLEIDVTDDKLIFGDGALITTANFRIDFGGSTDGTTVDRGLSVGPVDTLLKHTTGVITISNSSITLQTAGGQHAQTRPPASGGFAVNNTLTGSGLERVATESDIAGLAAGDFKADGTVPMTAAIESDVSNGVLFLGDDFRVTTSAGFPALQHLKADGINVETALQLGVASANLYHNDSGNQVSVGSTNVNLQHFGLQVARTTTAAAGGLLVDNGLTGAGFERVLTESDLVAGGSEFLTLSADFTINNSGGATPAGWSYTFLSGVQYAVKVVAFMENPAAAAALVLFFSGSTDVDIYNTHTLRIDPAGSNNAQLNTIISSLGGGWSIADTGGDMGAVIETVVLCSANKTMSFLFGQSPATVGNSTLKRGSYVQITRLTA